MDSPAVPAYWNHNVHYDPVILAAVPRPCATALDVGCADGRLTAALATRCGQVTGIDPDPGMITLARRRCHDAANVALIENDFLAEPFGAKAFEFICANTALHHMDFEAALTRMRDLLRPGGRLAVVGLARAGSPADLLPDVIAAPTNLLLRALHQEGSAGAPVADPPMTWSQIRSTVRTILPGATYRRRLLWRYTLTWRNPS